jgi:hypothetical protein
MRTVCSCKISQRSPTTPLFRNIIVAIIIRRSTEASPTMINTGSIWYGRVCLCLGQPHIASKLQIDNLRIKEEEEARKYKRSERQDILVSHGIDDRHYLAHFINCPVQKKKVPLSAITKKDWVAKIKNAPIASSFPPPASSATGRNNEALKR